MLSKLMHYLDVLEVELLKYDVYLQYDVCALRPNHVMFCYQIVDVIRQFC